MSIEGIALEHLSTLPQKNINSTTPPRQRHAVFHSFLSGDIKQDAVTTTAHRKRLISLIKEKKVLTTYLSKIWENTDGCSEQYICDSALYLMSVMSQCYSVMIDPGISAPGHGKEVVYGLNAVDKIYIYKLMSNVQLHVSKIFDSHMQMHTGNQNYGVSLAK